MASRRGEKVRKGIRIGLRLSIPGPWGSYSRLVSVTVGFNYA